MFLKLSFCFNTSLLVLMSLSIFNAKSLSQTTTDQSNQIKNSRFQECGRADSRNTNFITGAQFPVGHWPWMASLGFHDQRRKWNHKCGATLISDKHFLTAAHCLSSKYKLRIGESDHASEEDNRYAIDLEIINSTRHPEYDDETAYFDVAILETEKVNFSRAIRPICLPDSPSDDADKYKNDQVELIGWGQYHLHSDISDKLKRVSLKIFPMSFCNFTHTQRTISTIEAIEQKLPQLFQSHLLCAGITTTNQGSCSGDSGGPLMYQDFVGEAFKWIQIATVQGSVRDCGDVDFPGIYVRLDDPLIFGFIQSVIKTSSIPEEVTETVENTSSYTDSKEVTETVENTTPTTDNNNYTANLQSCRTEDPEQFCKFPFWFENRLRFECVRKSGPPKCPTIVDPKTLQGENFIPCDENSCPLMKFHDHPELIEDLDLIEKTFPENVRTFSIGKSKKGYDMKGVRISTGLRQFPVDSTIELRPMVKLVGNIHGNEPIGRELLIQLSKYLNGAAQLKESPDYSSFPEDIQVDIERALKILETTDLWLLPTMNPDGFARAKEGDCYGDRYTDGRQNEGKQDLNRNFPSYYDKVELDSGRQNQDFLYKEREQETKFMINWILQHPFTLSANFQDGAVLVQNPYNDYHGKENNKTGPNNTPDHDTFYRMATTYTNNHATMNNATENCEQWGPFPEGITNGADWEEIIGGMQDFNYLFTNAMELTVHLSCCKYPSRERLLVEWDNNFKSLLAFIEQAQRGMKGAVRDSNNNPVRNARIRIKKHGEDGLEWRNKDILTSSDGKYWRLLVPGSYSVQAADYNNSTSEVKEVDIEDVLEPFILDFTIKTNTPEVIKAEERLQVQSEFPQKSSRGFLRRNFQGK